MNVELLRRAQASIMDPNNDYNLMDWNCCIAGHIFKVAGADIRCYPSAYAIAEHASLLTGVPQAIWEKLFSGMGGGQTRQDAVQQLDYIIAAAWTMAVRIPSVCLTVEPCSALEPRSRSARAEDLLALGAAWQEQQEQQERKEAEEAHEEADLVGV